MTATPDHIELCQPDDWHVHLRDGAMLEAVAGWTARQFARAIVMPNLPDPVTTTARARAYRERIVAALPDHPGFAPLMTLYLTDHTDPADLAAGFAAGTVAAAKLYPAHATTNAQHGVSDLARIAPVLARMEAIGMPLLIHGEATDPAIDIFDREAVFIERVLAPTLDRFPGLKVVLEHITTAEAVAFVEQARPGVGATITPHHLQINRNAMFAGGIRPHAYCLPVAKRERHRLALRRAATAGSPRFFLGTDSAPHPIPAKEAACGCAGIFNAPFALETYAEVFAEEGALERLEAFSALHGPAFYGLAPNSRRIRLERAAQSVPERIAAGAAEIVPYRAGEALGWRFAGLVES